MQSYVPLNISGTFVCCEDRKSGEVTPMAGGVGGGNTHGSVEMWVREVDTLNCFSVLKNNKRTGC